MESGNQMKHLLLVLLLITVYGTVHGQHQEIFEKPEMYKGKKVALADTTSILSAFRRGQGRVVLRLPSPSTSVRRITCMISPHRRRSWP